MSKVDDEQLFDETQAFTHQISKRIQDMRARGISPADIGTIVNQGCAVAWIDAMGNGKPRGSAKAFARSASKVFGDAVLFNINFQKKIDARDKHRTGAQ